METGFGAPEPEDLARITRQEQQQRRVEQESERQQEQQRKQQQTAQPGELAGRGLYEINLLSFYGGIKSLLVVLRYDLLTCSCFTL